MKQILCLMLAILPLFLFSACGEPPTVDTELSASFTVTQDEIDYAGTLTLSNGALHIQMTAPYTVEGLSCDYSSEGLSISYGGLSTRANSDYLPSRAIPEVLHNTLSYLPQASYTETKDGADHFTLPTPYGDAELTAQDGVPQSLTDPHTGLDFTFNNSKIE